MINIQNIKNGNYAVKIYAVGYKKNDAYTAFLNMDYIDSLSKKQVEQLKACSDGRPLCEFDIQITNGTFAHTIEMNENDVYMLVIKKI